MTRFFNNGTTFAWSLHIYQPNNLTCTKGSHLIIFSLHFKMAVLKTFFFDISFSFYFFNHTEEQRERETGEEQQQHRPQRSELAFRDLRIYFRVLRLKYEIIFDPT